MLYNQRIEPPFFKIGPKSCMYGAEFIKLAKVIDALEKKYDVREVLMSQYSNIYQVDSVTENVQFLHSTWIA